MSSSDEPSLSSTLQSSTSDSVPQTQPQDAPIPLSMPSILVNPRLRHLQSSSATKSDQRNPRDARSTKKEKEMGKRRKRRFDNARFVSNPHITRPTLKDYSLSHPNPIRNPEITSNLSIPYGFPPTGQIPSYEASSAHSGQFTLGLKEAHQILKEKVGVEIESSKRENKNGRHRNRRNSSKNRLELEKSSGILSNLKGKGKAIDKDLGLGLGPAQRLVLIAERELRDWLNVSVYVPSENNDDSIHQNVSSVRGIVSSEFEDLTSNSEDSNQSINNQEIPQLAEISRYPHSIIWILPDPFLRLAVHCLARTLGCPSFSKDPPRRKSSDKDQKSSSSPLDSIRQTFILNPNPLAREPKNSNRRGRDRTSRRTRSTSIDSQISTASITTNDEGTDGRPPLTSTIRNAMNLGSLVTPPTTDVGTDVENGSVLWESESQSETSSQVNLDSSDSDKDLEGEVTSEVGLSDVGESNENESENENEVGDLTLKGNGNGKENTSNITSRLERTRINTSSPLARKNVVEQDYDEEAEADLDSDSDVNSRLGDSIESLP